MSKLESLKNLLELQIDKGFDIELRYKHTELNKMEVDELVTIIHNTNQYWQYQELSVDGVTYNRIIIATHKNNTAE